MKLSIKISSLLIISFSLVVTVIVSSSVYVLRINRVENIQLFKEEFLELDRELFSENSNLIFNSVENKIRTATSSSELINNIKNINPENVWIYSINNKKYLFEPKNQASSIVLNENEISKYIDENILNLKIIFNIDNFEDFLNDQTNKINPTKIQLHFYTDQGIIVGYTRTYESSKVRITYIQQKNEAIFRSYILSALVISLSILVISIIVTIFIMQTVVINPLKKISLGLEQVKKGILDTKIDIKNKDEIGEIADVFNSMTQDLEISKKKLEEYSGTLEQKIIERTTELNSKVNELEKMNELMINRELKMIDLKKQIRDLEKLIET